MGFCWFCGWLVLLVWVCVVLVGWWGGVGGWCVLGWVWCFVGGCFVFGWCLLDQGGVVFGILTGDSWADAVKRGGGVVLVVVVVVCWWQGAVVCVCWFVGVVVGGGVLGQGLFGLLVGWFGW
ncbi:hypothetical protein, partial [Neisseria sp. P0019.S002]|uniref:hypothetical protein n=1 Tax=Neisseria sp. P0019.S002 TaxID=3436798 RepID=UPI003F820627